MEKIQHSVNIFRLVAGWGGCGEWDVLWIHILIIIIKKDTTNYTSSIIEKKH